MSGYDPKRTFSASLKQRLREVACMVRGLNGGQSCTDAPSASVLAFASLGDPRVACAPGLGWNCSIRTPSRAVCDSRPPARARQPGGVPTQRADRMKRREFITLFGGAAAAWPLAAHAQQTERMRRIGVLMNVAADDPEAQARNVAFLQGLHELGWTDDRDVRIDYRWAAGDADRLRRYAAELVALAPDVVLASGTSTVGPLQRA